MTPLTEEQLQWLVLSQLNALEGYLEGMLVHEEADFSAADLDIVLSKVKKIRETLETHGPTSPQNS